MAVLCSFALACGAFTFSFFKGASERAETCRITTSIARIEAGKSEEERPSTERFERQSKDRFGLSQHAFDELVRETQEKQINRATQLKELAQRSC